MIGSVALPPKRSASRSLASGGGGLSHTTLDLEHLSVLKRLGKERKRAADLKAESSKLLAKIAAIEAKAKSEMTDADFDNLKIYRQALADAESEFAKSSQDGDEVEYYMRSADILFKYYSAVERGAPGGGSSGGSAAVSAGGGGAPGGGGGAPGGGGGAPGAAVGRAIPRGSILSYFTKTTTTTTPSPPPDPAPLHHSANTDRATLFDHYMQIADADGPVKYMPPPQSQPAAGPARTKREVAAESAANDATKGACGHCGSAKRVMNLQEGYVYCKCCHTIEYILIDHDKPSYKDSPKEAVYFAYKRINHFNEWLNQVQGKETTEIPEEIYDAILLEIKKQKLTNMASLTRARVKTILKKLRENKYYEHCPHIINRINGIPSPMFSQELEERLRHMFCMIQVPFLKHRPPHRKNFLSYSFCLNKMVQLLEKDEYLESFPLLKSREKLHQQDLIWQKICADLGWDFIPSL